MHYARRILLAAAPLVGCSVEPDPAGTGSSSGAGQESSSSSSAGSSTGSSTGSSSGGPTPTTGGTTGDDDAASGDTSTSEVSSSSTSGGDDSSTGDTGAVVEPAPDFMLIDVNPSSATFDQPVSPRDYLEQVSGWYFAHAT